MNRTEIIVLSLLVVIFLILGLMLLASAPAMATSGQASNNNPIGFSARPILPENQLGDAGYFSLLTAPGTSQTIEIEISNHLDEPITIEVAVRDAQTSQSGVISYQNNQENSAPPLSGAGLSSIASIDWESLAAHHNPNILDLQGNSNTITLAPNSAIRVPILIAAPIEPLEGHTLGGISVTRTQEAQGADQMAFAVRSVYSYVIALQLQSEREPDIKPNFSLESVMVSSMAGFPAIIAHIANNAPLTVTGAALRLCLYKDGAESPILDISQDCIAMAPYSLLPYGALLPGEMPLAPGSYAIVLYWTFQGQTIILESHMTVE